MVQPLWLGILESYLFAERCLFKGFFSRSFSTGYKIFHSSDGVNENLYMLNVRQRPSEIQGCLEGYGRVSAKRTPSYEKQISTLYDIEFSPLIPNWWLKNVYDVIRPIISSSSSDSLHCKVQERKKRENNFGFFNSHMDYFSTHLTQTGFCLIVIWSLFSHIKVFSL